METAHELKKAKRSAARMLKIRPQSVFELREKLLRKKISLETVNALVDELLKLGLLDDRAFTQSWIRWRLQRSFGLNRIAFELKVKGIDKEIIQQELSQLCEAYSEDETAVVLARRQMDKYKNVNPEKKKKRLGDFLARRGFSIDIIQKVFKKL